MKKLIICAAIAALGITGLSAETLHTSVPGVFITMENDWMKSPDGTWTGMHDGKKTWYKLNTKDASLWWSMDGKKWEMVSDGMWQDKEGKWLKISEKKLVWSADGGKTWSEVPDWTWEDADGNWCKFDKDWTLWMKKGGM